MSTTLLRASAGPLGLCAVLLFAATQAAAATLEVPAEAPAWKHAGAALVLWLHIAGGAIGILSGAVASASRKGQRLHRRSGATFFAAMFVAYLIAAFVAPFLADGRRPNFIAAILALYLLLSGADAARRRSFEASFKEQLGLAVALLVTAMGMAFAWMGARSETGTVDGSPPQAFVIFIVAGLTAVGGEVHVIYKKVLSSVARQRRHLWRMCASFFIASGSLFFGQPQVFPAWFNASPLPALLAFAPLMVMIYWLFRLRHQPAM